MSDPQTTDADEADHVDPSYAYKASLVGSPLLLWLRPDALEWTLGARAGRIRYATIHRVRLMYRPATMQSHRFTTEIWSTSMPKMQIVSTSWHGLAMQQRQDAAYAAFVTELHRRLAAERSSARFQCGMTLVAFGLGLVVVAAMAVAFAVLIYKAVLIGEWRSVAIIGILCVALAWQLGNFLMRNRPGEYRPDAVPRRVLPKA